MVEINNFLDKLRATVQEVDVLTTIKAQQQGGILIDVRERDEIATESPVGAIRIPKGLLEMQIENHVTRSD